MGRILYGTILLAAVAAQAHAFDAASYRAGVATTIMAIEGGKVDVSALIAQQEKLMEIGVAGIREYVPEHPEAATLLNFVAANADAMKGLTLAEIEAQWHEGGAVAAAGIDMHVFGHFSPVYSLMDTVVHPATAVIALRDYSTDGNEDHLDQVVDELSEVIEHVKHIN